MKKLLPLCVLLLLFSGFALGQTKEIDSLKRELLKPSLHDSVRVNLCLALGVDFYQISIDSLGKYSKQAIELSKLSNNYKLGVAYNSFGLYKADIGQLDSARVYYKKAIPILKEVENNLTLAQVYSNYASTLIDATNFNERLDWQLKAADLLKNNPNQLAISQYNLAVIYSDSSLDSLAVKYLKLSTATAEKVNNELVLSHTLPNLVYYLLENNKLMEAKGYLDRIKELCNKLKTPKVCYMFQIRAGLYYDKIKKFETAETYYAEALKNAKVLNDNYDIMFAYIALGEHFVSSKEPKKAIENFKKFQIMNVSYPTPDLEKWAFEYWAKAEKAIGNFEYSMLYLEKYSKIQDSINASKNKSSLANAEAKYQTEKKDKEIAEQQLALSDQKLAIQENKSKTRTMLILIVSLLLGSILLWFSFSQRQKRMQQQLVSIEREQEVRTLESLMEGEEKERLRIAKELHDGVNGDLSAIKFKLVSLLETNNAVINEAVAMIDNSCEQVRSISHNLVPPSLRDFDLLEAVENYCNDMNAIHKPEISFQHVGDAIVLEKKQEANVFRIIQELVTNAIKHAEAKEILVQLSHVENTLQLTVEDDGKGFDAENTKTDGIGMQNIRSRVAYLDGSLDVKSDEKGTSFTISLNEKTKDI